MVLPLAFLTPSFGEMMLIGIIALLLYGSDLPDVARTWGKAYQEFRRHLNGIRGEFNDAMYSEPETPRKLQYYPEFQDDAVDGEVDAEVEPADYDSPVARAAAEAEAAAATSTAASDHAVADDGQLSHDAHGAA